MPGKISKRGFKNFDGRHVEERIDTKTKKTLPTVNRVSRGVTGRDGIGYSPVIQGSPYGVS
jgi:hypothetical protein